MPYLVDGNNVMAQRVGWHRDKPAARRRLLDELAQFASRRKVKIRVVFDGAPEQHFADGSSYRGVRLYFATRGSDADARIKELVEAARERRTLIVVTSDRALASYVSRCGAQVMRSGEFRRKLEEATEDSETQETEGGAPVPQEELGGWMRYFGFAEEDEE